ncbi:hypothetical protein [Janthinobacterium sp. NKUCC06_STL]|uniref:hypothetical protein n=1 Tax=Janthinobacterium sp. NKUCC06_STL TaxID=2842127 RepID=UPI001C5B65C5|nr:hypothetical protein [Janthinobacterium sp. NKUCC06_STL]MBW3512015.1 hypothetical protein [Janthinobacterium sp. NKUCC06_STL]
MASAQQQLGQLRHELAARVDDERAAPEELATVLAKRAQLTHRLAKADVSAEAVAAKLERAGQDAIEARMALAAQQGQAELLAGKLVGVGAERDQLAQENAALPERALAGAPHVHIPLPYRLTVPHPPIVGGSSLRVSVVSFLQRHPLPLTHASSSSGPMLPFRIASATAATAW